LPLKVIKEKKAEFKIFVVKGVEMKRVNSIE
jgi:hypothetical protein